VLAYLHDLRRALEAGQTRDVARMLRSALATQLPGDVVHEARAALRDGHAGRGAKPRPRRTILCFYRTRRLVTEPPPGARPPSPQLELPFVPPLDAVELDITLARARQVPR
jgi:hypothetical protein